MSPIVIPDPSEGILLINFKWLPMPGKRRQIGPWEGSGASGLDPGARDQRRIGHFFKGLAVASGRRTKRKLTSRPKHKRARSLKDRRMKARKAAAHKRGLARNKAKRRRRVGKSR